MSFYSALRAGMAATLFGLTLLVISGCRTGGNPKPTIPPQELIDSLAYIDVAIDANGVATSSHPNAGQSLTRIRLVHLVEEYYGLVKSTPERSKQDIRNEIIDIGMILVDQRFEVFRGEFSATKKSLDTGTDVAVIALNSTAAVIVPSSTTQILAAIAAGVTGTKASIDKNYFYEKSVPVLLKAMEAQRTTVRASLIQGIGESVEAFPLTAALGDLYRYQFAGSIDGSFIAIQQLAAEQQRDAERTLGEVRLGYAPDRNSDLIYQWLNPAEAAHAQTLITAAGTIPAATRQTLDSIIDLTGLEDARKELLIKVYQADTAGLNETMGDDPNTPGHIETLSQFSTIQPLIVSGAGAVPPNPALITSPDWVVRTVLERYWKPNATDREDKLKQWMRDSDIDPDKVPVESFRTAPPYVGFRAKAVIEIPIVISD
jgi:hypothetical protein